MFCPQCGSATAPQTRFCKACGSALFDLLPGAQLTPVEAQAQLRKLKATKWLAITPLCWLFSLFCAFVAAVSGGPEQEIASIFTFFTFFFSSGVTAWNVFNLWRSGFFKTYREQRVRAEAALLNKPAKSVTPVFAPTPAQIPDVLPTAPQPVALFGTVTEHTTRELQPQASNSGKVG